MCGSEVRGFYLHAAQIKILAYVNDVAAFCANHEGVSEVPS